jgi:hypothetical protein
VKTARERAYEAAGLVELFPSSRYYLPFVDAVELSFKEHARDQRHLCAEAVQWLADGFADGEDADPGLLADRAHSIAMNAPAPGHVRTTALDEPSSGAMSDSTRG